MARLVGMFSCWSTTNNLVLVVASSYNNEAYVPVPKHTEAYTVGTTKQSIMTYTVGTTTQNTMMYTVGTTTQNTMTYIHMANIHTYIHTYDIHTYMTYIWPTWKIITHGRHYQKLL